MCHKCDNGPGHMYDSVAVSLPILSWLSALSYCSPFWRRCVLYIRSRAPIRNPPPQLCAVYYCLCWEVCGVRAVPALSLC
jgi:hypothetical protein